MPKLGIKIERTFPRYTRIENQIIEDSRLRPRDVMVYVVLAYHADNSKRECWPTLATIGKRAGLREAAVRESVKALEKYGYLKRIERKGTTPIYKIGLLGTPPDDVILKDGTRAKPKTKPHGPGKPFEKKGGPLPKFGTTPLPKFGIGTIPNELPPRARRAAINGPDRAPDGDISLARGNKAPPTVGCAPNGAPSVGRKRIEGLTTTLALKATSWDIKAGRRAGGPPQFPLAGLASFDGDL